MTKDKEPLILLILSLTLFTLFTSSCSQAEESESDLISKIKAVQQQMMVQGNISEAEELAMSSLCSLMSRDENFDDYGRDDAILFKDVDNASIYNGCEDLTTEETKACFNESISKFIKQEFDYNIIYALGLSEPQQVATFFIIDENGSLSGMKIRDTELTIQAEIARVLKKVPKMKPATHNGIKAPVLCSMLVTYGSELTIELKYISSGPIQ